MSRNSSSNTDSRERTYLNTRIHPDKHFKLKIYALRQQITISAAIEELIDQVCTED